LVRRTGKPQEGTTDTFSVIAPSEEMVQLDASFHPWLEVMPPSYCFFLGVSIIKMRSSQGKTNPQKFPFTKSFVSEYHAVACIQQHVA